MLPKLHKIQFNNKMYAILKSITKNYVPSNSIQPALDDFIPMKRSYSDMDCSSEWSVTPKKRRADSSGYSSNEEFEEFDEIFDHRFTHKQVEILVEMLYERVWIQAHGPYAPRAFARYLWKINEVERQYTDPVPKTSFGDLTNWAFDCMVCREDAAGFTHCGHYSLCAQCAANLGKCPLCKLEIDYFHYA